MTTSSSTSSNNRPNYLRKNGRLMTPEEILEMVDEPIDTRYDFTILKEFDEEDWLHLP